jgi:hypothetical protein
MKTYSIKEGYKVRLNNMFYNDTGMKDEWQKEVYVYARQQFDIHKLTSVWDIGTGSGFKLLKYFNDVKTLGTDLTPTVDWLKKTYPDKEWSDSFDVFHGYDMIICSDVIEHIPDPDPLLDTIEAANPKLIVFSTPDRMLFPKGHDGPPDNICHVREWTTFEFGDYISSRFQVLDHFISNEKQATQCLLACLKPQS